MVESKSPLTLFIGNPGVGKSTLMNGFLSEVKFESGIFIGKGLRKRFQQYKDKMGNSWGESPGLVDEELRVTAGKEIGKSLQEGGAMKIIFVVMLVDGRIRLDDKTTMGCVINAANLKQNQYSIIINKLTPKFMKIHLNDTNRDKIKRHLTAQTPSTDMISYNGYDEDLDSELNKFKEPSQELRDFVEKAYVASVVKPKKVETRTYQELSEAYKKLDEGMGTNDKKLVEEATQEIQKKSGFDWWDLGILDSIVGEDNSHWRGRSSCRSKRRKNRSKKC